MSTYRIEWPRWDRIVNPRFIPLIENRDRYLLLWGGRGSSKSVFVARRLIYLCLTQKYFRWILIRRQYNSIKDSQYQTLKDLIYEMNLQSLFEFRLNPMEISCVVNGNKFLARGCDDTTKLKSVKDPTGAWYEEEIPEENDFITITTSIRTQKAEFLQEIFTFNPEVEGDYQQHWFYKRFFENQMEVNFTATTTVQYSPVPGASMPGNVYQKDGKTWLDVRYTSHHSTYLDNRWISAEFVAFLESLKVTNPFYYTIYCLGRWGNRVTTGQFYKLFQYAKNGIINGNNPKTGQPELYNPDLPLQLTWDFNVKPFVTCCIHQVFNNAKRPIQIDEVCLPTPNNRTDAACREVERKYSGHGAGMNIFGDPAGMADDTRSEKGYNDFVIIRQALARYHPDLKVLKQAPPVKTRGDFINTVFATGYEGLEFLIGYNCTHTINDYLYLKEAADGLKKKEKTRGDDGVEYEKYGHPSDANDYFYCAAFSGEFARYQRGGSELKVSVGKNYSKNKW